MFKLFIVLNVIVRCRQDGFMVAILCGKAVHNVDIYIEEDSMCQ